ncbi:DDRGK domain family protein [Babesia bovis T2Bo]|uniref:DDRGK domain-containing protein 1 n=1 Tax=Babesia bovis TaxID=5865 RepID=A7AWW7_BABBO|nr:DDRGK domain family protein [Babesia bovis T2Bo]EDO05545.1 DDRGK domain family protein [Babesia bovis T2Bo]BAN64253.1 conserved hypothetical protein [Babesia bovis]|eukprot:XP_001609113.1 hypothetical protein [Babesia bovis T2Bo]
MDDKVESPVSYTVAVIVVVLSTLLIIYFFSGRLPTILESESEPIQAVNEASSNEVESDSRSLTVKQRKKQELKEAKRQQRALIDEERKEKEKLKQQRDDLREKRREEKERQRQEEEEKRAAKAQEAYEAIASEFVVEQEGTIQDHEVFDVEDFINFVIEKKMTTIVELAAKFDLDHKVVASRLNDLELQGRLFGLLDERGRYLYISDSELDALDHYINKEGRIDKYTGLTSFCNATISMAPSK